MNAAPRMPLTPVRTLSPGLSIRGISKSFQTRVLSDIDLDVAPGEVVAVTGPSGAGKTTLCRVLAGLERPEQGTVSLGGRDFGSVPAPARRVALMFESYALYPHLTVRENALSPLRAPNSGAAVRTDKTPDVVDEVLELLEIRHLADRLPAALSGGQKQRVALARTLVQTPSLFLFDEPISHLDAKLRHKLRGELRRRLIQQSAPVIWVTPDGMEALSVADRVAVIDGGRLEQVGTPEEIWLKPASARVARLLGDPPMNLLPGEMESVDGTLSLKCNGLSIPLPPSLAAGAAAAADGKVTLGLRPDAMRLCDPEQPGVVRAEIYSNEPFGKHAIVTVDLRGVLLKAKMTMAAAAALGNGVGEGIGQPVGLTFPNEGLILFEDATGRALSVPTSQGRPLSMQREER